MIPDFSNKWLSEGHSEMSGDRNIGDRRYRIYGNFVRSEDSTTTVQLATIYFADMTEMFNIRDEFMRTRPVVSIVLIDNYDELTTNLSDSAISTLDAQLNDVVANWTTGLEALCRKIERNRYLVIFESKDLPRLQESPFFNASGGCTAHHVNRRDVGDHLARHRQGRRELRGKLPVCLACNRNVTLPRR